jgi:23S rRNA pseudouridine2605 synthase
MLLRRFLQLQTNKSRRTIFDLVKDWKISVNDNCVDDFKYVLKDGDVIEINDWKRVTHSFHSSQTWLDRVVVLFNKPSWCVVSKSDQYNETIFKYFPSWWEKDFYYVGRLDKNSRWLLLLVNDPHLVHKFEHPSHNHTKT